MNRKCFILIILLITGLQFGYGQADCINAIPICTNADSEGVVQGFGVDDFSGAAMSGCLEAGGVSTTLIEQNSHWFRIKMTVSGEFGFNIIPNDLTEDWDFAVYGPSGSNPVTCGALTNPIACNYSGTGGITGVGVDPNTGTQTGEYVPYINVTAGTEYLILVNQYDGNNAGFSITFSGQIFETGVPPLDCSILVDLGPDRTVCDGDTVAPLNAKTYGDNSYEWYLQTNNIGAFNLLAGENQDTLNVTVGGTYRVIVTSNTTGAEIGRSDVIVTFSEQPVAGFADDISDCDYDGDGIQTFDLSSRTFDILNGQSNMSVSYHSSKVLAESNLSPLATSHQATNEEIWARIQNDSNTNCFDVISFWVRTVPPPVAAQAPDIFECQDENVQIGRAIFDLEAQNPFIKDGQAGVVTYYTNKDNADEPKGWIPNPNAYNSISRTIWARFEPVFRSKCYDLVSFEIVVLEAPVTSQPQDVQICDDDDDGYFEFDFNDLRDEEILGGEDPAVFVVHYFSSQFDADTSTNPLTMPYTNATPYAIETIYARMENVSSSKCFDVTSFTTQVFDSPRPALAENIPDLIYCDNDLDGDDTNGYIQFDLTERQDDILDGQSPFVFELSYFEDAGHQNQIPDPTTFSNTFLNGQVIYVQVRNSNPNNITCVEETSFRIEVKPLPNAMLTTFEFYQCDEDGSVDGIANFNLTEAEPFITFGNSSLIVTFHLSYTDASSKINIVDKLNFSNSTSSTVYARVESVNGCFRIVEVDLIVTASSFPPGYMHYMPECDDDGLNDGFYEFNLSSATSEIISLFSTMNLRVSFFRNEVDALLENNVIDPSNAYVNEQAYSQTIWVRVESADNGGCFGVGPYMELSVNAVPEFDVIDSGFVCLNNAPLIVTTENPSESTFQFEWYGENGVLVSDLPYAEIQQGGIYTVVATSIEGCASPPKEIIITESEVADFTSDDISVITDGENNSLSIQTENQNLGIGNYEFALDDALGIYQDEPIFENVYPGLHTVYVRDKNDCGIAEATVYVIGYPNFFTPNNDGVNDTWNIRGVDFSIFVSSNIYIFDRYGKQLAHFAADQPGWNGRYNDAQAMSSDYWFIAELVDTNGAITNFKGHFSLVRR